MSHISAPCCSHHSKHYFRVHYPPKLFWYSVFRFFLLFFSLHEFYLGSGQFRIKHASLIFFTSHFISVLCYRNTLSTVFVTKFVTRKSHVYKFTTRRQTVLGKQQLHWPLQTASQLRKFRFSLCSLGRHHKQKKLHANSTVTGGCDSFYWTI